MHPAAIIYDFDGTLARGNIQENSFIPDCGETAAEFWARCDETARRYCMDPILAYMHQMLRTARERGCRLSKAALANWGASVRYFDGVEEFFPRVNARAAELGVQLQHFIISSGTREMLKGTSIAPFFAQIYASSFAYDEAGEPFWPAQAINYTTKTQFIFRINKGIADINDNDAINAYTPEAARAVRFSDMIYIGDGMTDIPSMKLMREKGGLAVAVYDPAASEDERAKVLAMLEQNRAHFACAADYREGSGIDRIVGNFLEQIALKNSYAKGSLVNRQLTGEKK